MPLFGKPNIERMKAKRNVRGLIKALRSKREWAPGAAARALGEIGDARAVEPLIAVLEDQPIAAAEALAQIGDARGVEALADALSHSKHLVHWSAARALVEIGDARGLEVLANSGLHHSSDWTRKVTVQTLGKIGNVRAVELLIGMLKDSDWGTRQAAVEVLGEIGDTNTVEPLIANLWGRDSSMRRAAVEALGRIGDTRAVEPLITVLKMLKPKDLNARPERTTVIEALEAIGWQPCQDETSAAYWIAMREWDKCTAIGVAAIRPLINALKDSNSDVQRQAAIALGNVGNTDAVHPLIAVLKDKDNVYNVRYAAAAALGKIGHIHAVEPLISVLQDTHKSAIPVRPTAARALGEIGDARATEPLIAALADHDSSLRWAATEALDNLGWRPSQDKERVRYWIARKEFGKCVEIGIPAVEPLHIVLKDDDERVRRGAAEALGEIGNSDAVEALFDSDLSLNVLSDALSHVDRSKVESALIKKRLERKRTEQKEEIKRLVDELIHIGHTEGFLSLRPGGIFDETMKHIRTREIGKQLDRMGGFDLMQEVGYKVAGAFGLGSARGRELEVAWGGIGRWRG